MGMSTHVYGIVPADDKYNEMKALYDMCKKNDVSVPDEVWDFFDGDVPDSAGMQTSLDDASTEFSSDMETGYEVDISKIDPKIKIIRFTNSW